MRLVQHWQMAFKNLLSAKLRSCLAILGVLIGTAAVVALMTSSELAARHALSQFKTLGTHVLSVTLSKPRAAQDRGSKMTAALRLSDLDKLNHAFTAVRAVAPYAQVYLPIRAEGRALTGGSVMGVEDAFLSVAQLHLAAGRWLSRLDQSAPYAVIGATVAQQLKRQGQRVAIGQQILVGSRYFTIIGVLQPWSNNLFVYADLNRSVMVPISAALALSAHAQLSNILIKLGAKSPVVKMQQQIQAYMQAMLPHMRVDVRSPVSLLRVIGKQQHIFSWLLAAIGGISLLVGGIGVMNIMLVSVVERRREIGVRMAVGAQEKDILGLFLCEAMVLTGVGGVVGVVVGVLIAYTLSLWSQWGFTWMWLPPILGLLVSVLVGLISGFYPAWRAAQSDPMDALRSD